MPDLAGLATGFNMAAANVNAALGFPVDLSWQLKQRTYCTQVILHSRSDGRFSGEIIPEHFRQNLKQKLVYYNEGDLVNAYQNSQDVIGVNLYSFDDANTCTQLIDYVLHHDLVRLA